MLQRLLTACRLTDNGQIGKSFQEAAQSAPHDAMVVYQRDSNTILHELSSILSGACFCNASQSKSRPENQEGKCGITAPLIEAVSRKARRETSNEERENNYYQPHSQVSKVGVLAVLDFAISFLPV